jgi:predicted RND superfamily exporter protein
MNIQEEKVFIYKMMRDITAERRKLTDTFYDLKKRLDELTSLEEQGLENLSIKGYTDLYNQKNKEYAEANIQREASKALEKINSLYNKKEEEIIPSQVIQQEKTKDRKRKGRLSPEKFNSAIIETLKEAGNPIKCQKLYDNVMERLERNFNYTYFKNKLRELEKENEKITKPIKGYYQYNL